MKPQREGSSLQQKYEQQSMLPATILRHPKRAGDVQNAPAPREIARADLEGQPLAKTNILANWKRRRVGRACLRDAAGLPDRVDSRWRFRKRGEHILECTRVSRFQPPI